VKCEVDHGIALLNHSLSGYDTTLKMEAAGSCKVQVLICQTMCCCIPEDWSSDLLIIFCFCCLPVLFSVKRVPYIDIAILLVIYTEAKTKWIPTPRTSQEVA
jgi:hypothetical protein